MNFIEAKVEAAKLSNECSSIVYVWNDPVEDEVKIAFHVDVVNIEKTIAPILTAYEHGREWPTEKVDEWNRWNIDAVGHVQKQNGTARVGEEGPELSVLPKGKKVITNSQAVKVISMSNPSKESWVKEKYSRTPSVALTDKQLKALLKKSIKQEKTKGKGGNNGVKKKG